MTQCLPCASHPWLFSWLWLSVLQAGTVALTGQIQRDDQVIVITFTASSLSNVVIRTWSFPGGTNSLGQNIAPGGFDPNLALFDGTRLILESERRRPVRTRVNRSGHRKG